MEITHIIIWGCLLLQIYFTIRAYKLYKKYSKPAIEWYEEELDAFTNKVIKTEIPRMIEEAIKETKAKQTERLNLLSKENGKLMEENEVLRDKLKNLGFTDITLKH